MLLNFSAGLVFSQYNDTMYFKSGNVKSCTIREYDEKFLTYEYRGQRGKLVENRIAVSTLKSFVIYNEYNELIFDSKNPAIKTEPKTETETETEEE